MAHSRLEKIGTIYSRVNGLIRSGAMKLEDRPLWYDIYEAFPPKYPPRYDRPAPDIPVRQIFYPEDMIRAKFFKRLKKVLPPFDLLDDKPTLCQKCIEHCTELQKKDNLNLDEAFEIAVNKILADIKIEPKALKTKTTESSEESQKPIKIDLKEILTS